MTFTISHIEENLKKAAFLVSDYGDEYWPTFERLERELKMHKTRCERLNIYCDSTSSPK